jgi:FkbM family methyltransferase
LASKLREKIGSIVIHGNSSFDTVVRYAKCFGAVRGPLLLMLSIAWPPSRGRLYEAVVPGTDVKVLIRLGSSDVSVFNGVFCWQEYGWDIKDDPRTIIDAGAYTGLSAIYFTLRYPGVRIIAVEASESNYSLLVRNTARFDNIETVHAALWSQSGSLVVTDPGTGLWGLQVSEVGAQRSAADGDGAKAIEDSVRAVTVDDVLRDYNLDRVNLLKVDIEGSEREVFSRPDPWIHRVDAICIELHDWFKAGCSRSFFCAVEDFPVEAWRGENVLVARER